MKRTTLKFLWKNKTLYIVESEYCNNWHKYFWLYDKNGELFSDITTNFDFLDENEYAIDNDFINCCFENSFECYKRLLKNFPVIDYYYKQGFTCIKLWKKTTLFIPKD